MGIVEEGFALVVADVQGKLLASLVTFTECPKFLDFDRSLGKVDRSLGKVGRTDFSSDRTP
ncbi:hypothetical protein [Sutcliffiella horikoshii]|uniref:hypothetical protein n=1 Tax=Sutcliffiella horikoshii TaxID=79883 RepID=UPI003CE9054A